MRKVYSILMSAVIFALCVPLGVYAAPSQEEKCFTDLQKSMQDFPQFQNFYDMTLKGKTYADVKKDMSGFYKNMASFGFMLDKPLFDMRIATFGKQTSYVHPPYSPFPDSKNTAQWTEPAKEFIFSEEYIRDDKGQRYFLGCGLMQIQSNDLMNVKAENYLYDGTMTSILDVQKDYKAWYSENESYDYDNNPFVTWKRLFIYPSSTQNTFFSKYTTIDSFPHISLAEYIKKNEEFYKAFEKSNGSGSGAVADGPIISKIVDENGQIVRCNTCFGLLTQDELKGKDKVFVGFTMFQEAENMYPEFGKHLSMRGAVSFTVFKSILSGEKPTDDMAYFWDGLVDSRDFTKYAKQKELDGNTEVKNSHYDTVLENMNNLSEIIEKKVEPKNEVKIEIEEKKETKTNDASTKKVDDKRWLFFLVIGLFGIFILFFIIKILGRKS